MLIADSHVLFDFSSSSSSSLGPGKKKGTKDGKKVGKVPNIHHVGGGHFVRTPMLNPWLCLV